MAWAAAVPNTDGWCSAVDQLTSMCHWQCWAGLGQAGASTGGTTDADAARYWLAMHLALHGQTAMQVGKASTVLA